MKVYIKFIVYHFFCVDFAAVFLALSHTVRGVDVILPYGNSTQILNIIIIVINIVIGPTPSMKCV